MSMKNKQYKLQLKNGEEVIIDILKTPVYQCEIFGDASNHYMTYKEARANNNVVSVIFDTPYTMSQKNMGFIADEGVLFSIYRSLRNPIVKLELCD